MKWSDKQVSKLRELCLAEVSNAEIAKVLGVTLTDVHAKRSQLGITIPKVKAMKDNKPAMNVNPGLEKAAQGMDTEAAATRELAEKQSLLKLLEPAIIKADKSVDKLQLIDEVHLVCIIYKNAARRYVDIEGDNLLAIISDVIRKCMK
jgi:hypothetical protein